MMDDFLRTNLRRVIRRHQQVGLWRKLSVCWSAAALAGMGLLYLTARGDGAPAYVLPLLIVAALATSIVIAIRHYRATPDYRWIAQKIEKQHPELGGVLITAVQQHFDSPNGIGYFQFRLLQEAVARSQESDWRKIIPRSHLVLAHGAHLAAMVLLALVLWQAQPGVVVGGGWFSPADSSVAVTPGDTSIEKGESLVVLARFARELPASVTLVVRGTPSGPSSIPLVKSLADPVFGGSVATVETDFFYHLEYAGGRTRDYKVTVFEHPRLERADVGLVYPAYTDLPERRIEDTRRVTAVEGTQLDLALQLNKPVESAVLVGRDADKTRIPLIVDSRRAVATLADHPLVASQTYDLQLVDADGRANKRAIPFVIEVQPNRPPELRIVSPRGDVRPSALEELGFSGTVWDDFGSPVFGLGYTLAGQETEFLELGRDLPGRERRSFDHLLHLEDLGVQPEQLISWFLWADDIGPDGEMRRTMSDLYFAEVRPFDEIFRESQQQGGDQQQGGQQSGGQQQELVDLQKQIISATWRLQRNPNVPSYTEDVSTVRDSQAQALQQAKAGQAEAFDPPSQALWAAVTQEMEKALAQLQLAPTSPRPLGPALAAEQAAYQALLRMAPRDTNVTRRQGGGGGGGGQQANQRQLEQLDLRQAENRYETQRQAAPPQSPERREEMQVMNRLQELARRQQDFNERLRELQTALQEARTEQEREELRRQLLRLQEEQRQMLADVDELQQRMDREENQSRMSEQRDRLEQTREDLQRAAEAAAEGSVAQALASGTRAQRELQEMRDEMRQQNSSQFAEDLREMRAEARDLARNQEEISQELADTGRSARRSLSGTDGREELLNRLESQRERVSELVDQARAISEQAEGSEPLLSRQLYDSLRRVSQEEERGVRDLQQDLLRSGRLTRDLYERLQDESARERGGRALELTAEMLRGGLMPQAGSTERRARAGIEELRRGVERAAESVLGDDAEALRLAQNELDDATEQLRREMEALGGAGEGTDPSGQASNEAGQQLAQGSDPNGEEGRQGQAGQQPGEGQGPQPGQGQGQQQAQAERQGEGQQPGQGEGPGQAQGQQQAQAEGQGQGQGQRQGEQAGQAQAGGGTRGGNLAGGGGGGGFDQQRGGIGNDPLGRGRLNIDDILGDNNRGPVAPLTGEDFAEWADRLRNVEELIDDPVLRNQVAEARERARLIRREHRQDLVKPDWAVVQLEIVRPLVEVRNRLAEELARRESSDPLVPIDRDPVPSRFAEQVRRYYEELGRDQ